MLTLFSTVQRPTKYALVGHFGDDLPKRSLAGTPMCLKLKLHLFDLLRIVADLWWISCAANPQQIETSGVGALATFLRYTEMLAILRLHKKCDVERCRLSDCVLNGNDGSAGMVGKDAASAMKVTNVSFASAARQYRSS